MKEDKIYTVPQVAKMLGLSHQTIYNWVEKGLPYDITYVGLQRTILLDFDEVVQWVNDRKKEKGVI